MHPFVAATALSPSSSPGTFTVAFDATWVQGRGAYGGLVSAVCLRAMQTVVEPRRVVRSLTVHFCAPARPGPATVVVKLDRQGAWVAHTSGVVLQEGEVVATCSGTFAADRPTVAGDAARTTMAQAVRPDALPFADVEPIPVDAPLMPVFTQHFEYRLAWGALPFSASNDAALGAWLRPRAPVVVDTALAAAVLVALPPAISCRLDAPRAMATVDWTVRFLHPLPLPHVRDDDAWLVTARTHTASAGYTEETDELWSPDGRLVAQAHQLIAIV